MEKIYNKTQWENTPSTNTPINETNLNNIENGVDALDDRVVELSNTKSNVDWVQLQKSGDKIAEITIDGVKKTVYAKRGSGGGGGGTTDYEDLDNKPKINNVELNGNKTLSDLGINAESVGALPNTTVIPTTLAELAEDTTHRTVTDAEKTKWNEGGGGSTVSWNQIITSGTKIAEVSVDGNKTDVYAPTGGSGGSSSASDITYDNSTSGMTATNVQDAIDEQKQDLTQFEEDTNDEIEILKNSLSPHIALSTNVVNVAGWQEFTINDLNKYRYISILVKIGVYTVAFAHLPMIAFSEITTGNPVRLRGTADSDSIYIAKSSNNAIQMYNRCGQTIGLDIYLQ